MPSNDGETSAPIRPPQTVDEAADEIIETLDLEERVRISNLPHSDVKILQMVLGQYTEKQLERSYIDETYQNLDAPYGPANVIERVWEKLRETHRLKVVK